MKLFIGVLSVAYFLILKVIWMFACKFFCVNGNWVEKVDYWFEGLLKEEFIEERLEQIFRTTKS